MALFKVGLLQQTDEHSCLGLLQKKSIKPLSPWLIYTKSLIIVLANRQTLTFYFEISMLVHWAHNQQRKYISFE